MLCLLRSTVTTKTSNTTVENQSPTITNVGKSRSQALSQFLYSSRVNRNCTPDCLDHIQLWLRQAGRASPAMQQWEVPTRTNTEQRVTNKENSASETLTKRVRRTITKVTDFNHKCYQGNHGRNTIPFERRRTKEPHQERPRRKPWTHHLNTNTGDQRFGRHDWLSSTIFTLTAVTSLNRVNKNMRIGSFVAKFTALSNDFVVLQRGAPSALSSGF